LDIFDEKTGEREPACLTAGGLCDEMEVTKVCENDFEKQLTGN
jgi:hypothetical protein